MRLKKIYYIPGLISIIGLPVLLFFWGPPDYQEVYAVKLHLTSSAKDTQGIPSFNDAFINRKLKGKKIIHVDLEGFRDWEDERADFLEQEKYRFLTSEIARAQITGNTMSVLQVQFREQSTYAEFVWVVNQAIVYNFQQFALVGNNFYFFPHERIEPVSDIGYIIVDHDVMPAYKQPTNQLGNF